MGYLWAVLFFVGIALQLLVIHSMTKGAYRAFAMVFAYSIVLFLTSVVEGAAFFNPEIYNKTSAYYWTIDAIRHVFIFCTVISLVHRTMGTNPKRPAIRRGLVAGALLFAAISLSIHSSEAVGMWMTKTSRNLSFCAVILNLALWAALIKSRHPDRTLLMVTGGLGVQMAGKAIGHSLRELSRSTILAGNLLIVLSHLFCLYVWWQAFRNFDQQSVERYNKA